MKQGNNTSLRERFYAACSQEEAQRRHDRLIARDRAGTLQDFFARFDAVADTLVSDLETLIEEMNAGRSPVTGPAEGYRLQAPPLQIEIAFPASCTREERCAIFDRLAEMPAYRRIHDVCASAEVDMNITAATRSAGYQDAQGKVQRYQSVRLEIFPHHPYAAEDECPRRADGSLRKPRP